MTDAHRTEELPPWPDTPDTLPFPRINRRHAARDFIRTAFVATLLHYAILAANQPP